MSMEYQPSTRPVSLNIDKSPVGFSNPQFLEHSYPHLAHQSSVELFVDHSPTSPSSDSFIDGVIRISGITTTESADADDDWVMTSSTGSRDNGSHGRDVHNTSSDVPVIDTSADKSTDSFITLDTAAMFQDGGLTTSDSVLPSITLTPPFLEEDQTQVGAKSSKKKPKGGFDNPLYVEVDDTVHSPETQSPVNVESSDPPSIESLGSDISIINTKDDSAC